MENTIEKVYRYGEGILIPQGLQDYMLNIKLENLESINTMRLGEDVILSGNIVPMHTDGTVEGKETIMLVLLSYGGFIFHHECGDTTIHAGDIIRFDGNKLHGLTSIRENARFSAIIWDIPIGSELLDVFDDLKRRAIDLNEQLLRKEAQQ